ncbi:hypothetical protein [Bacillus sp. FJAT-28004]|uniref:hypothetical protein n=1 Tax=Bacillus sp. FJAT-28004 TaxID=1679165 RepID=UPI0006B49454|nr:hypothetical protein [Bacillus sp. FJAT-28004]
MLYHSIHFEHFVILGESSIEDWKKYLNDYTVSADYKAMLTELYQLVSKQAKKKNGCLAASRTSILFCIDAIPAESR